MKTIAYVDHSFHKKTLSTDFLREILSKDFKIINLWDDSWKKGKSVSVRQINNFDCEYVLFFQILPPISELKRLKPKIIWVPMYDSVVHFGNTFWLELSTIRMKVVSFSNTLTGKMQAYGLDVLDLKYFFDPKKFPVISDYSKINVFYWQRTNLGFSEIKKLFGDQRIDQFILKLDPDPGYSIVTPSKSEIKANNIKIVAGFVSKEEYLRMLSDSNIFILSRRYEGIGMSFIEAMTMGLAVVAMDNPTMNEYIKNGENGYLFDRKNLEKIDFSNTQSAGTKAADSCYTGYRKWQKSREGIKNFILSDYKNEVRLNATRFVYVKVIRSVYSLLRRFGINLEIL